MIHHDKIIRKQETTRTANYVVIQRMPALNAKQLPGQLAGSFCTGIPNNFNAGFSGRTLCLEPVN
jgi:hypothetical protein